MPKTEIILTHNVVGLGAESDQIKVAAGYARNYLFPQGLAIPLTAANKRRLEALRQRRAEREAHEFNTMNELAKGLSKMVLCPLLRGNVAGDDGGSHDFSVGLPEGRNRKEYIQAMAVFSDAHRLEVLNALAHANPFEDVRNLVGAVFRSQQ